MKTTPDLPTDPLGNLGHPIRNTQPAKPDPVHDFSAKPHELIGSTEKAMDSIVETLRKSGADAPSESWCCRSSAPGVWLRYWFDGKEMRVQRVNPYAKESDQ